MVDTVASITIRDDHVLAMVIGAIVGEGGIWFSVTPLSNGHWMVSVKREWAEFLKRETDSMERMYREATKQ